MGRSQLPCGSRGGAALSWSQANLPSPMRDPGKGVCTLTRNSVADLDKDFLEIGEVAPGRLEHVHEAVDEQVLHPADQQTASPLALALALPHSAQPLHTVASWAAGN